MRNDVCDKKNNHDERTEINKMALPSPASSGQKEPSINVGSVLEIEDLPGPSFDSCWEKKGL